MPLILPAEPLSQEVPPELCLSEREGCPLWDRQMRHRWTGAPSLLSPAFLGRYRPAGRWLSISLPITRRSHWELLTQRPPAC